MAPHPALSAAPDASPSKALVRAAPVVFHAGRRLSGPAQPAAKSGCGRCPVPRRLKHGFERICCIDKERAMLVEVKVPALSESVAEATLLSWHKKQGEFVKRDENLIDIETDKIVLELPAPASGVLSKVIKGDGGTVASNEVIATIDTDAKTPAGAEAAAPAVAAASPAKAAPAAAPAAPAAKTEPPAVMPAAKKIA